MLAVLDVHYDEVSRTATAAAVVFRHWQDAEPIGEYAASCSCDEPYVPGEFFKRELPCLLAVLEKVRESLSFIIVDGYVSLGDKPGLGKRLWDVLPDKIAIVSVAKTRFRNAAPVEVTRGRSKGPLFVTAVGIDPLEAGEHVRLMHGPFRTPTLLKRADRLARG